MKIAVVILNWNGKELLEKFLPSVIAYSKEATIYVADNASTDDSISFTNYEDNECQSDEEDKFLCDEFQNDEPETRAT